MKAFTFAALTLAAAQSAMASLKINNWTGNTIYYYFNNDPTQYTIAGNSVGSVEWDTSGAAISVKISPHDTLDASEGDCMQFEYNIAQGEWAALWYDLSLINGNPFGSGNIKISPTGNGLNTGTCVQVKCDGGVACHNAYQAPDDNWATHNCPADTGDMWVDIGEPDANYNSRSVHFTA